MKNHHKILGFLKEIDAFKTTYRMGYVGGTDRRENDAEHTRHMCMFALLMQNELGFDKADLLQTLKIILVHDLVEIYADDVFAFDEAGKLTKNQKEREAADKLFALLPEREERLFHELWNEYENQETIEANFAKTVDKLQAVQQNSDGRLWQEENITETMSRNHNEKVMVFNDKIRGLYEEIYNDSKENFHQEVM